MPPIPEDGIFLEKGGQVTVEFKERKETFKKGDVISLTPQ